MVQTWLKGKYTSPKPTGRYRSGHNDSHKKVKKTGNRLGVDNPPQGVRTLVIDGGTGKRRWRWL